jgi:threonine dehydrogenase-like Zn-dependent dehydrogenase
MPLASPGDAEVIVQALCSGVSRGTETLIFKGAVPPSEYGRMRAPFQEGEFPAPVKYGYCMVGRVLQGPSEIVGRDVFCLHPHQDRFVIPRSAVHVLPTNVPASRAVLAANLETALNGLWDAGILPGDRVTVIGAGSVGCLVAWLAARIPGCDVELVDINPQRSAIADALGARFALPGAARGEANIVLHASGTEAGANLALQVAGFEATVVEMSWFGSRTVSLPLGEAFHSRRLIMKSSQVGQVAAARRAHHSTHSRLQLALSLLTDAALDGLINSESRFVDLPQALQELSLGAGDVIMHRVRYD